MTSGFSVLLQRWVFCVRIILKWSCLLIFLKNLIIILTFVCYRIFGLVCLRAKGKLYRCNFQHFFLEGSKIHCLHIIRKTYSCNVFKCSGFMWQHHVQWQNWMRCNIFTEFQIGVNFQEKKKKKSFKVLKCGDVRPSYSYVKVLLNFLLLNEFYKRWESI